MARLLTEMGAQSSKKAWSRLFSPVANGLRAPVLPLIIAMAGIVASLLFWRAEMRNDQRQAAVFGEEQARTTAEGFHRATGALTRALVHLVERNGATFRETDRWTIDLTGLKLSLWVEPSGQVHQVVPRTPNEAILGADLSNSEAVRKALQTNQPAIGRSSIPAPSGDSHLEIAIPVRDRERLAGFLVGVFSTDELLRAVFSSPDAASGWDLSVVEGGREVYRRGSASNWAAEAAVEGAGVPARLRLAPRPEVLARIHGNLPLVILATGIAIALLLASSVGFAQAAVRRADEARESQERYRHFFEADLAGAVVTDPEGLVLDANPSALRMFGLDSVAGFAGRRISSLYVRPEQRDEMLAQLGEKGRADQVEIEMRTADGRPLHVLANLGGRRDAEGKMLEIHAFLVDITDKRRVEVQLRQAQKMEAIGRLAGGVAHDFNNLLGVITGYGELLDKDLPEGHPGRRRLREIRRAAESAASLTRQLLTFSRQQALETRILDVNEIVPSAEKMLRRLIGEDIHLVTNLAPDLGRVRADAGQIEQVIMNLAINARDAMPEGGRLMIETANVALDERYVATHPAATPGPHVMLAVSDTGHGMDANTIAHMFEPFFTTKEKGKGTGLGLATVYGIVQKSGGTVNVYSEAGHGTSFKVYLPRIEDEGVQAQPAGGDIVTPRGTETILLVEDSDSLRELIREVLEAAGYAVNEASTAQAAAHAVTTKGAATDLLLTDVIMPGMSGPDLAARLGSSNPRARVLYISGYTDEMIGSRGRGLDPGTNFLQKPFTFEALLRKVRDVLDAPS
jgi:PAS domain S-box-containing protein